MGTRGLLFLLLLLPLLLLLLELRGTAFAASFAGVTGPAEEPVRAAAGVGFAAAAGVLLKKEKPVPSLVVAGGSFAAVAADCFASDSAGFATAGFAVADIVVGVAGLKNENSPFFALLLLLLPLGLAEAFPVSVAKRLMGA